LLLVTQRVSAVVAGEGRQSDVVCQESNKLDSYVATSLTCHLELIHLDPMMGFLAFSIRCLGAFVGVRVELGVCKVVISAKAGH
jgi:hypothetical protein